MIRQAERRDIRELAQLWARAFPGDRTVEERERHLETGGVYGGLESAWIAERAGRTVGAFRAYALTQHMHGAQYRMMGLAAVAVDETARRRGVARELCESAARIARERGDVFSVLYPFRPAFYHSMGWGLAGELHAFRFRPESLPQHEGLAVLRASQDDVAGIASCYARFAKETNGLIVRTPRIWRQQLEGAGLHVYITGDDQVRGYVVVRQGRSESPEERPLYIRELVAENHHAYESLLGWLSTQRDSTRVIHYEASPDENFVHRLREPRPPGYRLARFLWSPVARTLRGPMLRVLNVERAFTERRRWGSSGMPLTFGLEVHDDMVPENRGPFTIEFDGARASVTRGSARPLLRIGAAALAQVLAGEFSVRDALTLNVAEADGDVAAVDSLLRVDRCFRLMDEF